MIIIKANIEEKSIDTHQLHYILLHHFTIIIIIFDTVLRQKLILYAKDNEFNSAAISLLWHLPTAKSLPRPDLRGRHTATVGNVNIALSENIALLLHLHVDVSYSLVVT